MWSHENHYMFIVRICISPVYSLHAIQTDFEGQLQSSDVQQCE